VANNRIYFYCPPCKASNYLAKCMGEGFYRVGEDIRHDYGEIGYEACKFLAEHLWCDDSRGQSRQVELRFEHHDDKDRELPPSRSEP